MPTIFIAFPPAAGGNHCKNMIDFCLGKNFPVEYLYKKKSPTAHADPGSNLQNTHLEAALNDPDQWHVLHGHFGEILSFANQIRKIIDKRFILISPDSSDDRRFLNHRRKKLGLFALQDNGYFDFEQVFLYESFMYHYYLEVPMEKIINISINEWFTNDIDLILDKIAVLLDTNINKQSFHEYHTLWLENNQL